MQRCSYFRGKRPVCLLISRFSLVSAGPLIFTCSFLLSFHPHLQEAPPSSRSSTAWDCTSSPFFKIFQELLFGHHDNSHPNPNTVIFYPIYGISFLAFPLPWSLPLLFYLPPLSRSLCQLHWPPWCSTKIPSTFLTPGPTAHSCHGPLTCPI